MPRTFTFSRRANQKALRRRIEKEKRYSLFLRQLTSLLIRDQFKTLISLKRLEAENQRLTSVLSSQRQQEEIEQLEEAQQAIISESWVANLLTNLNQ